MLLELIAAISIGFGAAGLALLAVRFGGAWVPRASVPVAAGAAMLGFAIWSEYSWFQRTTSSLPKGIEVAETFVTRSAFRPWTHVAPFVSQFSAVDLGTLRRNPKWPGTVIAEVYLMARYMPAGRVRLIVDCGNKRHARIGNSAQFDDNGRVSGVQWSNVGAGDKIVKLVCPETR